MTVTQITINSLADITVQGANTVKLRPPYILKNQKGEDER